MNKPNITKECLKPVTETKFLKMADLQYAEGRHYYVVSRHTYDDYVATKTKEEVKAMPSDAVTCFVIVRTPETEPRLLFQYEFRYPAGQFLLSPPAGLVDKADLAMGDPSSADPLARNEQALLKAARREIHEETGVEVKNTDRIFVVNPLLFSSPGMTDESNAIVCAVIDLDDLSSLGNEFAEGTECFDGFELLTKEDALAILGQGTDKFGMYYSVYTWAALLYFASGAWE